jgi:hypothetical protein
MEKRSDVCFIKKFATDYVRLELWKHRTDRYFVKVFADGIDPDSKAHFFDEVELPAVAWLLIRAWLIAKTRRKR